MNISIKRDYDATQPMAYSAPQLKRVKSDPMVTIGSQVTQIQHLWDQYYNPAAGEQRQSRAILGQILHHVNDLEALLAKIPSGDAKANPEITVFKDYLLACRLNLQDTVHEPEQSQRVKMLSSLNDSFELRNVPGDGNCAIHAALTTVDPAMNTYEMVHLVRGDMVRRMQAAFYDEIDNHWDDVLANKAQYIPTLGEHHGDKEVARRLADQYCQRMGRPGAWLGEREMPFLSDAIGKTISVYKPQLLQGKDDARDGVVCYGQHKESVALFLDAHHYQALLPKT